MRVSRKYELLASEFASEFCGFASNLGLLNLNSVTPRRAQTVGTHVLPRAILPDSFPRWHDARVVQLAAILSAFRTTLNDSPNLQLALSELRDSGCGIRCIRCTGVPVLDGVACRCAPRCTVFSPVAGFGFGI